MDSHPWNNLNAMMLNGLGKYQRINSKNNYLMDLKFTSSILLFLT